VSGAGLGFGLQAMSQRCNVCSFGNAPPQRRNCGSHVPASLLAFVIMHGHPKFVASPVCLHGCMIFCSGGDALAERPTQQGSGSVFLQAGLFLQ